MRLSHETLDDVLYELYPALLKSAARVPATRGDTREIMGVSFEIAKPRARLSRTETRGKPFSCLGELLWYLAKDNTLDFIGYYIPKYREDSDDQETLYGAYGPRLFGTRGPDQIENVVTLLQTRPSSRRAVVQLFDAEDLEETHKEIPCTTTIQFLLRDERLHGFVTMRSNDAYKGLPHDVFCFTMLQELIARRLGAELGTYHHFAGSMHLYDADEVLAEQYISERIQQRVEMPAMPIGDPRPAIRKILAAEDKIRNGENDRSAAAWVADPYWADLIRLLQILAATGNVAEIDKIKAEISFAGYRAYIEARKNMKPRGAIVPRQPRLPL